MKLNRVNEFLKRNEIVVSNDSGIILNSPDTIKNIVVSEILDIAKLDKISDELISYLSKDLKRQSRKDQQSFLRDVEMIKSNKRDFVFRVAQETNKNEFLYKIFNLASQPKQTVISENGEVFESSITEENRAQLSELIRDILNEKTRIN